MRRRRDVLIARLLFIAVPPVAWGLVRKWGTGYLSQPMAVSSILEGAKGPANTAFSKSHPHRGRCPAMAVSSILELSPRSRQCGISQSHPLRGMRPEGVEGVHHPIIPTNTMLICQDELGCYYYTIFGVQKSSLDPFLGPSLC